MNKIELTQIGLTEVEKLLEIASKTFAKTFSVGNTRENMKMYLDESFSINTLMSELTKPGSEFYFAAIDNKIIGYLKLNFGLAQTELKDQNSLEIERIYVLKEFQRKNVGQLLMEKALQIAGQIHADFVWLGVWEKNTVAINFYRKNGFAEFDKHIFKLGEDLQTDIMMKRVLPKFVPLGEGAVNY